MLVMRKRDAFAQMAVDEAILDGVVEGSSEETIRFFDFSPPAITIGRLQKIEDIDEHFCRKNRIDIVRRLTGGRAVVHSGDFTFSLIIKRNNPIFGGGIYKTYRSVSASFLFALKLLNVPAEWQKVKQAQREGETSYSSYSPLCFSSVSRYELTVRKKKILGVSQYRKKDAILVQGSLPIEKPLGIFFDLYPPDRFFSIKESGNKDIGFESFSVSLRNGMEKINSINLVTGKLSSMEIERTNILKGKYCLNNWNYRKIR